MTRRFPKSLLAVATFPFVSGAWAQEVDTSEWVCEYCPFEEGHDGDYSVGASSVSDDSAYFGNYTGYDEKGGYANLDGDGAYSGDGYRMRWHLEDLALDSRVAELEGGRQGTWDYELGFRQIPYRRYFTTSTVFSESGSDLLLPSDWVFAGTTSGLTALGANLEARNIESDRSIFEVGGRYLPTQQFTVWVDYRRQEQDGLKIRGGPSYTNASLLPMPFDYVTDEVDVGLRYDGDASYVSLGWYVSDFQNKNPALAWQQPFFSAAGAETPVTAQAPDNQFQQLRLAGGYSLTEYRTVMSASVAIGNVEQTAALLPYTSNTGLATGPLPRPTLDGDVDTTNVAVSVSSRIVAGARIRLSYRYDERDNKTPQDLWDRVITDTFVSNDPETNVPYSFERSVLKLSADYQLLEYLRVSAGYDRLDIDRDYQEVAEQSEDTGWGRVVVEPLPTMSVDLRAGASKRDVDAYDETFAGTLGQNPLMRKYNLAYRYRTFGDATFTWSPGGVPVSIALNALYAEDEYRRSLLGLTGGDELSATIDFSWSLSETASIYANVGVDELESTQVGSDQFASPDWSASNDDSFTTVGAGFRVRQIADKLDVQVDYNRSDGTSKIDITSVADGPDSFPDLETRVDFFRLRLVWQQSERMGWNLDYRYQRMNSDDWLLAGVRPDTIPTVLSLGARPYDDDSNILGIGFSYQTD